MHETLRRELERIGASRETAPDGEGWARFVRFVDGILWDADQTAYRLERSLKISSQESQHLHERQRALARCAGALLLATDGSDGVYDALAAVGALADVDGVWVERRCDGQAMEVVASVGHGVADAATRDVTVESRAIVVNGQVQGRLNVSRLNSRDTWGDEANLVNTVASMFGAHWSQHDVTRSLEALIAAKDRFVASVSHELRTPLTAVVGFAAQLSGEWESTRPDERRDLVDLIYSQSLDVSDLIDDLLVVARSEIDALKLHERDVDLLEEARGVCLRFHDQPYDIGLTGEAVAWADPRRVRQIVRNLVTNAFRYGGDTVGIHVAMTRDRARLEVRDNGPGVEAAVQEAIFRPFQSAHPPGTQPDSIGLGLWVGRELAHRMGGSLSVRSQPGDTAFILELPPARFVDVPDTGIEAVAAT
jgi:signal transduction histidine kinase